jgi:hypothetical protein
MGVLAVEHRKLPSFTLRTNKAHPQTKERRVTQRSFRWLQGAKRQRNANHTAAKDPGTQIKQTLFFPTTALDYVVPTDGLNQTDSTGNNMEYVSKKRRETKNHFHLGSPQVISYIYPTTRPSIHPPIIICLIAFRLLLPAPAAGIIPIHCLHGMRPSVQCRQVICDATLSQAPLTPRGLVGTSS